MSTERELRLCALYPSVLSIYADRGNVMVLRDRCNWRGIAFTAAAVEMDDQLDGDFYDIYYIGGGQDRDQLRCAADLARHKRSALVAAADRGALIIGVCGGYQLLGHGYRLAEERLPGVGLLDLETVQGNGERLTGNVAVQVNLPGLARQVVAGFENHAGRTRLGQVQPFGEVLRGRGNNGADRTEGAIGGPHNNVLGTYLHGPLLAKNARLADWLIARALGLEVNSLDRLDDSLEQATHRTACRAAGL